MLKQVGKHIEPVNFANPTILTSVIHEPEQPGIRNLGNSCYQNAVLQCFSNILLTIKILPPSATAIQTIFKSFHQSMQSTSKVVTPVKLRQAFANAHARFDNKEQQDAHEYFLLLIDTLASSDRLNPLHAVFNGRFLSSIVCNKCSNANYSTEIFRCVEVELPDSEEQCSILSILQNFSKTEVLSQASNWKCHKCKHSYGSKSISINHVGDSLAISVKRFLVRNQRITKKNLPVAYSVDEPMRVVGSNFTLNAAVCHFGNWAGGHYKAIIKTGTGWLECDDHIVKRITSAQASSYQQYVYIFFFTKV